MEGRSIKNGKTYRAPSGIILLVESIEKHPYDPEDKLLVVQDVAIGKRFAIGQKQFCSIIKKEKK